jgi:Protein of unknown function (DUF2905)
MTDMGKLLVLIGAALAVVGAAIWGLGRVGFRGLPGDVSYEGSNFRFYFPIVTCVILSILLTGGLWIWRWLSGR